MRRLCSKRLKKCAQRLRHNATLQEGILWRHLRNNCLGIKFRRQAVIDDRYVVDFVCLEKNLVIEIDGSQHAESKEDLIRSEYLKQRGFKIVRFWNKEINQQLQACLEVIYSFCSTPSPYPLPLGRGKQWGKRVSLKDEVKESFSQILPHEGEGGRSPDEGESKKRDSLTGAENADF